MQRSRVSEYIVRMMALELPGRSPRARPMRTLINAVNKSLKSVGAREEDGKDRFRWRQMIHCSDS